MDLDNNITVIPLNNRQINFYPKRNLKIYLLIFVVFYLCLYSFLYLLAAKVFNDPHVLSFYISSFFSLCLSGLIWSSESIHHNPNFPTKTDKDRKTREDRVREFWEKVLVSQDEIFIERVSTEKEKYLASSLPAEILERETHIKMLWRKLVLFERDNEGYVSHLEGMPALLFLKD